MTKTKSTKHALVSSVVALFLCFTMLLGTTYAWFTDSVTSSSNIIRSGNLDVEMYWAKGTEALDTATWTDASTGAIFNNDLWEPGYVEVRHIKIENKGSLALKYKVNIVANGDVSELADVIDVYYIDPAQQIESRSLDTMIPMGTLSAMLDNMGGASSTAMGNLLAGEEHTVTIALKMQETAGNEYQNKSIGTDFSVKLNATQYNYENDSFGEDYDEGLNPEAEYVSSPQGLKDAMLVRGANIALNEDIVVDSSTPLQWGAYMFVANGREVTIDMNGHDIIVEDDALLKTNAVFTTANGGTLNIVGDGTITVKNGRSGIFHAMNANDQINVYGGTFVSDSDNGSDALAIMYTNSGNIDVYGGKFCPLPGVPVANAEDRQGNRLSIVFHEGALMSTSLYYTGYDATRIQLAEGCYLANVEIDGEEWWQVTKKQEDVEYSSDYEYIAAGYGSSCDYVLDGNLTADNYLYFGDNTSNTIDLNGKTVDATGGFLFVTDGENCSMTIDGNGTVNVDAGYAGYASNSGSLNINGGTFMLGETNNKAHLYSQNSATIVINDGEFISTDANTPIVYCINGFVEINGGFFQNTANPSAALLSMGNNLSYINNQKITLSGGTFVNWNPITDSSFAYDWPQCPALIVLADGYTVVSETQSNGDVWYTVVPV